MAAHAQISDDVFLDRLNDALDAFEAGDEKKVKEITKTIPLPPEVAKRIKSYMSKTSLHNLGFDMSLVEAELGKDWIDES